MCVHILFVCMYVTSTNIEGINSEILRLSVAGDELYIYVCNNPISLGDQPSFVQLLITLDGQQCPDNNQT